MIDYLRSHQHFHAHFSNQAEHVQSTVSQPIIHMPATPYKILLAEDNEFNQDIAVELLTQAGYAVEVANNGQEVLNKLFSDDAQHFHLILMDLEMPVMDGHEATLLIRQQKQFNHLPIIALTAHAMTGTKERCVEEGMQDYLTKPFEPAVLYDTIASWLGEAKKKDAGSQDQSRYAHLDYPFHTIEPSLGLRSTAQNHALYIKLLNNFCHAQKTTLEQLGLTEPHQPDNDFSRLIHTLKSASATIGATHVADAAEAYENYLAHQLPQQIEPNAMRNIITHIAKELEETITELDQYFAKQNEHSINTQSAPCSKEEILSLSTQLSELLTTSNVEALDYFEKELNKFSFILDRQFPLFTNAIRNYDFDRANEILISVTDRHS
ncbi:MAG: response regulator [Burkholderiales bacterium]|nr:response regulator [Burkholderiales bacterium]